MSLRQTTVSFFKVKAPEAKKFLNLSNYVDCRCDDGRQRRRIYEVGVLKNVRPATEHVLEIKFIF